MIPKQITYNYILAVLRRRFWYVVISCFLVLMATIAYCIKAPRQYVSTSLIVIQPQEVPPDYVRPTVTSDIRSRLNTITDEVLSRSALQEIIRKIGLYPRAKDPGQLDAATADLRQAITINIKDAGGGYPRSPSSFEVSYEGGDPVKVRDVTAELADLFVTHNYRLRAEQATGTLKFISSQLEGMRETLRQKEALVRDFKEKYQGLLPEQMPNNTQILTQLQQHLDTVSTNLQSAEDRKILLETQTGRLRALQLGPAAPGGQQQTPNTLDGLRQELQRLQSRYSDKHPDVVRIKRLIAAAEKGAEADAGQRRPGEATDSSPTTDTQRLVKLQRDELSAQREVVDREIQALRDERDKIRAQIEDYRRRIETGPKVEQMFVDLRRDYQQASDNYQSLLQKKLQAEAAENLERSERDDQLKIVDAASLPRRPTKPNLRRILLLGLMAALACGFGLAFLLEYLDRGFWTAREVEDVLGIPVLVTVPFIYTRNDLRKKKVRLAGKVCALCVMGSALLIALVLLWKSSSGHIPS
jgi:polysaccharide chain length determinant protein (PEP-CTERM system associated)